ncbi:hypothetical protein [Escherichia coli]|uniref:hypothetical protein n=1 Tax=Escherichia coli TaxID=562 RepID=UPI0015624FFB|nr:hypothetical protein [Escherichia coli]
MEFSIKIEANSLTHPYDYNASLNNYLHYFENFSHNDWNKDSCRGYFTFRDDDRECVLFFLNYGDNFSLRYDYTQSSDGIVSCWYSNHEDDKMNIIVDADTEQFIPLGSCLPPDITLSVIKDFFKNPLEKSKKVKWMNADDIDWSSVY